MSCCNTPKQLKCHKLFFKQTSGFLRFINQFGSLIIAGIILPLTFFNGFKKYNLKKLLRLIRKVILLSLIVVSIYAFIEVLIVKFGMLDLKIMVLNIFDYFPFTEAKIDPRSSRISSVSFEAPALGTYLLSIAGWMFSYIITSSSKWKYIPTIIVVVLAFLSGSRGSFFYYDNSDLSLYSYSFKKYQAFKDIFENIFFFYVSVFCAFLAFILKKLQDMLKMKYSLLN